MGSLPSAPAAPGEGPPSSPTRGPPLEPWRTRLPRLLIRALAVYSALVVGLISFVVLVGSHDPTSRAILLMALGLVLLWVVLGGALAYRFRDRVRAAVRAAPGPWALKFFLFATGLVLLEEAITTTMTNLAPQFGSEIGVAYITASNNYLIVIAFSSVVVILPEFVGWTWLLRRYDFSPNEVFLLYGLLGETMEATVTPSSLWAGFWFFVYGLMLYLPAYALPSDRVSMAPWWSREARPRPLSTPRWSHYLLAYFVPLACALPVAGADTLVAHALHIHLWG